MGNNAVIVSYNKCKVKVQKSRKMKVNKEKAKVK